MSSDVRTIAGYEVDTRTNTVVDGTKPVQERFYHSSKLKKNIKCWDEKRQRYINTELFSPVIYDLDDQMPKFDEKWVVYDNPNVKKKKVIKINYPRYYLRWWYKQRQRCLKGYTIGGVKIDGLHYWYLNFWRIKAKGRGKGDIPPYFIDLDKEFFDLVSQARKEEKNVMFLKRRQIGFSEKVAAMCAMEYTLFPSSQSLIVAGEEKYAINTFKKALRGLDALSPYSQAKAGREFYKRRVKDTPEEVIAGFKSVDVTNGYLAQIMQITTKDNSQAASGKSPTLVIMEEVGINPLLKKVYNMILPSVREKGLQNGKIVVFIGTGGEMKKGVAQMMDMFYKPDKYNLLAVQNVWDKNVPDDAVCCPFFPAYLYHVMDNDGNSYKEPSMQLIAEEKAKFARDKEKLHDYKTQMPLTPQEAFSTSGATPFDTDKLETQRLFLINNEWDKKLQKGRFEEIVEGKRRIGVKWVPAPPGMEYDEDADGDLKYPCTIIEHPTRPNAEDEKHFDFYHGSESYRGLYGAGTDSYDKDKANTSDSQGSMVIMKSYLNANKTSMMPVFRMTWRPSKKEKFYKQTALACIYYGEAENLIEWSNIGIFDWYKGNGFEYLLKLRPMVTYATVKDSRVDNKYGVDPNTKHIWVDHFASYIKEYSENIYDLEAIQRFLIFRNNKDHNCDITISYMLGWENIYDDQKQGFVVQAEEEANAASDFVLGFATVNGRRVRL